MRLRADSSKCEVQNIDAIWHSCNESPKHGLGELALFFVLVGK